MTDIDGDFLKRPLVAGPARLFAGSLALWLLLLLLFRAVPGIDLFVARGVFTALACPSEAAGPVCGAFTLAKVPLLSRFRTLTLYLPYMAAAVLLLALVRTAMLRGIRWASLRDEPGLPALIALLLGSGLIVNVLLKELVGRPRPRDTDLFGGTLDFVPAGSFAGDCLHNCSFVSGEASSAGWLFCLIALLPARLRKPVGLPLLAISVLMPVLRVATGAHYLSDAVLGWLSSVVVFLGILALFARLGSTAPAAIATAATEICERAGRGISKRTALGRDAAVSGWQLITARPTRTLPGSRVLLQRPEAVLAIALAVSIILILRVDYPIGVWMRSFPQDLNGIVQWFSDLGTGRLILLSTGLIMLCRVYAPLEEWPSFLRRGIGLATAPASYIFLSVAGGGLVASLAKNAIGRARPSVLENATADFFQPFAFTPSLASFPSGHSATAGAMAFSLALLFPPMRPVVMTIGVLICLSRQMIGAHWPSDTVMGWAVGGAFALWLAHVYARRGLVFTYGERGRLLPLR